MTFTMKRIATEVVGAAMIVTPVAASAATSNPAASLSGTRAATPTAKTSKIGADVGGSTLINIGILAAIVAGVLLATKGDGTPASN